MPIIQHWGTETGGYEGLPQTASLTETVRFPVNERLCLKSERWQVTDDTYPMNCSGIYTPAYLHACITKTYNSNKIKIKYEVK